MLADAFLFFNELELLELRCEELRGIVDQHFLIESPQTFQGNSKPLFFTENQSQFKKYPITPIIVNFPDRGYKDAWANESLARHQGFGMAIQDLDDSDTILLSDLDEIPRRSKILESCEQKAVFLMGTYTYWLDFQSPEIWTGTVRVPVEYVRRVGGNEAYIKRYSSPVKVSNGGWHFSYQGGLEKIREKLKGFAHTEYSGDFFTNPERIAKKMITGSDLFDRDKEGFKLVSMENHPQYLLEHLDKFSHMCFSTAYASLSLSVD